jgi:hypothetical protein
MNVAKSTGRRALCMLAVFGMSFAGGEPHTFAVQRETQEEKEANLKKQAAGGLFHKWTFDKDALNTVPAGFTGRSSDQAQPATWSVQPDETAPSRPNVLAVASSCAGCHQLLLAEGLDYEYPDVTVRFRSGDGAAATGGIAFGAKDVANFYAAVVDLKGLTVQVIRVVDGREAVLAQAPVKLKQVDWHTLRVQRNTIISKDFIETFVDGTLLLSVEDQTLGMGQVGLLASGNSSLLFDSFHAVPLFSHRPLSAPAAY